MKKGKIILCLQCGKSFYVEPWRIKKAIVKFCSRKCKGINPEMRKRISKKLIGHQVSEATKRKIGKANSKANEGKKRTEEQRKKYRASKIGKNNPMYGKKERKNPNWKGGITPENLKIRASIEFRLWREANFARDNWTCQKCKKKGGRLHSHHIQNFAQYPELRFAINNGRTLCRKCHILFHKIYGKRNNNQEQIEEFFSAV